MILFTLIINALVSSIIVMKNSDTSEELLDKKEENIVTKNAFAIMVEDDDGYVKSDSNIWPSGMILNEELTNCVDINNNKVENALSYEDNSIIVETNKKIFCYVYFDRTFGQYLIDNPTNELNTTLEGGLYRYQGTNGNVNNYICFGTSDKDTCLENTDAHMYRIMGITEDGIIKILKKEALNSTMSWYGNYSLNITWPYSTVYTNINGDLFLTNATYVPNGWEDRIEIESWKYGDNNNVNITATELYNIENSWQDTIDAKIGLMYAHDYAYAFQSEGLNCSASGLYTTCEKSWINISQNDSEAPSETEWTMSRYGLISTAYYAWAVNSIGNILYDHTGITPSVRPVFYLKSDVEFLNGTGTIDNPYLIKGGNDE